MTTTFPPPTQPLLTFPTASLSHIIGTHSFPLSTGPCSLVQLNPEDVPDYLHEGGKDTPVLALSIPPSTTVVLGKTNLVRKTDQNEAHASYSFNFTPKSKQEAAAASSSPAGAGATSSDLLPSTSSQGEGYLKLKLPPTRNQEDYDDLTGLARTFESHLLTHHLLDTRLPPTASEDSTETISAVLSNWSTSILSGVRETAGVVYTGVGEYAGQAQEEVKREGVWGSFKKLGEGVKGVVLGPGEKGKGRAQGEPRQGEEGWKDVVGESIRSSGSNKSLPGPSPPSSKDGIEMSSSASHQEAAHHADERV